MKQVNLYIKQLLNQDYILHDIWIQGEISNYKKHTSGHIYFTLKDDQAAISCVFFKSYAQKNLFELENGLSVIVHGYISLYEKTGQYQVYVTQVEPEGKGALYKAFEQMKEKLNKEGLFLEELKKKIPVYPGTVGIITSDTGAAIRDIIHVAKRRNPTVQLILFPVLVQGEQAIDEISRAIEAMNQYDFIDVLIVGRGGGSIEDLWAFNDEKVARAIFQSEIPIISAVGHETDFTISDFAADMRAPTPSAAAELAIPNLLEFKKQILNYMIRLNKSMDRNIESYKTKVDVYTRHAVFQYPMQLLDTNRQYLDSLNKDLNQLFRQNIEKKQEKLGHLIDTLEILSPINQLNRGYAIVMDEKDQPITGIESVEKQQMIQIQLKNGKVSALIIDIERGEL